MFWTKTLIPTLKQAPEEAQTTSHKLLLRAGLVRMLSSGVYSYLPLGLRVLNNIQNIIREEMNACQASEVLLPALQPLELWQESGRDKIIGDVMFKFIDRKGRNISLGPTHEEVITELARGYISSYRQLPLMLYQIQTKFRDELRPRFGLIRACEFIMKDAYSFDRDEAGLDKSYNAMFEAYKKIFKRCGLKTLILDADSGIMGGNVSQEFMAPSDNGEDAAWHCVKCGFACGVKEEPNSAKACPNCATALDKLSAIEIGHIFKLGTKYSSVLAAKFLDESGKLRDIIMGCYGIGVSRLISAVIEQNNDASGIIWPRQVSPYKAAILALDAVDKNIMDKSLGLYNELCACGIEALFDDRDQRPGVKFKDAELIGIPIIVVVGKKNLEQGKLEIKTRQDKNVLLVNIKDAAQKLKELLTFAEA